MERGLADGLRQPLFAVAVVEVSELPQLDLPCDGVDVVGESADDLAESGVGLQPALPRVRARGRSSYILFSSSLI